MYLLPMYQQIAGLSCDKYKFASGSSNEPIEYAGL